MAVFDDVAVVVPCLNEAQTVADVVRQHHAALPGAQVWVVDNGSQDDTAARAMAAGARVLSVPRRGKGHALRDALWAVGCRVTLLVDGDATYSAEAAPALVKPVLEGAADMVIGCRHGDSRSMGPTRGLGNRVFSAPVAAYWSLPGLDLLSGQRAFDTAFVRRLDLREPGFGVETELTWKALRHGGRVGTQVVPYRARPRGSRSKLHIVRDGGRIGWVWARQWWATR